MRGVLAAVVFFLALQGLVMAAQEELRLKELGQKIKLTETKRRSVEEGLKNIDARSASISQDLSRLQAEIDNRTKLMQKYGIMIREYDNSLQATRELFRHKAVSFYKGALLDTLDLTLAHTELSGYLKAAVVHDQASLAYYQHLRSAKKDAQQGLNAQTKALNQDLAQLAVRMQALEQEKQRKTVLLASLQQESRTYQQEIERLMERIRARKKQEQAAYTGFSRNKGALPWPVSGTVVRSFGRYTQGGVVQISQGLDIRTAAASPVKSIFKGKVAYLGAIDRFGNTMIVDHGSGYYSIYGNVSRGFKQEGQSVEGLEAIAQTDAKAPVLHFEIRCHGKPQDPRLWLKGAKKTPPSH